MHQPSELGDEQRRAGDAQGHQRQRVDHGFNEGQPGGDPRQDADDHLEPRPERRGDREAPGLMKHADVQPRQRKEKYRHVMEALLVSAVSSTTYY